MPSEKAKHALLRGISEFAFHGVPLINLIVRDQEAELSKQAAARAQVHFTLAGHVAGVATAAASLFLEAHHPGLGHAAKLLGGVEMSASGLLPAAPLQRAWDGARQFFRPCRASRSGAGSPRTLEESPEQTR